jgi:gas vesicle protein
MGDVMDDRARIALGIGIGAAAGGAIAFLLFTERGRALRSDLEPQIEQLVGEAQRLTAAFDRTRQAVKEGLATLTPTEPGGKAASDTDWAH